MIKSYFTIIVFLFAINANSQVTGLPLIKGHTGGDTTVTTSQLFTVHGRAFTPVTTVQVMWDQSDNQFSVTGEVTANINASPIHLNMGSTTSYFQLDGNASINTFTPTVTDTFSFAGQKFIGIADETFYSYDNSTSSEIIHGDVSVILDGNSFSARMGSSDDPGTIIHNNVLKKVWVHIDHLISIKGITTHDPSNTNIILRHLESDPANTYYGFGNWVIFMAESVQFVKVGSIMNPGLVVRNSIVDSVKMTGGGGGVVMGVLPVLDDFTIKYNHTVGKYAINGKINIGVPMGGVAKLFGATYAPSFEINAGDDSNPGFLFNPSNGKFEVADVVFSLKRLNTELEVIEGGFAINSLTVVVENNWPDSIYGSATFPPGFALAISAEFHLNKQASPKERFYINSIGVTWEAANYNQVIPLGTTGFNIVKIGGEIDNLLEPNKLSLTGDIGLVFGDPVLLDLHVFPLGITGLKWISVIYVEGIVTLSTQGLSFDAIGDLGSLYSAGQWQGIIAQLEAGIDIRWGGTVHLDASFRAWVPPYDIIDATANISLHSSGDIDAIGKATLQVPSAIPVIGGKRLANANFALRHKQSDMDQSYAAGWAKFNLIFDHITAGIKAGLKSGKITKIGAAAARALTHQNISDDQQHPIGPDGEPDLDWYACGITHHFTLNASRPPAYLQNQLVIQNNYFHDVQQMYYSPAVATITSPSSSLDLKILTPDDPHDIYSNQGQTTPQDNTLAIDFTMLSQGGFDTIKFITVNQAAEAYGSIDWIHQPDLMLTPGEYVLTVTGYCPENGFPLSPSDIKYNVSPVYPRPTISLTADGDGTFTIDYSSYLTDSTSVSLYWNYDKGKGGNLIAHFPYHQGTLIGDSLYRWVLEDWFPGIIAGQQLYFYAVIDDYINNPVQTPYDSIYYVANSVLGVFQVNVYGGDSSTTVVLSPSDTTLTDVSGINDGNGNFTFANLPVGAYTINAYNADTNKTFNFNINLWGVDGSVLDMEYHSDDWVSLKFNAVEWNTNNNGSASFNLETAEVPLYGTVIDTSGLTLLDATVYLLDAQNDVVATSTIMDLGYRFSDIDHGSYKVAVQLPNGNQYHWSSTQNLNYTVVGDFVGIINIIDSIEITSLSKALDFRLLPGGMGPVFFAVDIDNNNAPVENVVISIKRQDGSGTIHQAVTNKRGLAFFDPEGVDPLTNYTIHMTWPDGYQTLTYQGTVFQWQGTPSPYVVIADEQ